MASPEQPADLILHASCVAVSGRAAVILGAAGTGKSTLALTLMAHGAALVSDDRVCLRNVAAGIEASAPPALAGLVEARGIGLLRADAARPARVACLVDLDRTETERLPPRRSMDLLGQSVVLLYRVDGPHFAPALLQFLSAGRVDPP